MATIEERLQAVEDRLEIIELEACYARAFDARDAAAWAGLFTSDGVYQARVVDRARPGTLVQGTQALHDYCRDAPFSGVHFMHLPQLTVRDDTATARIHLEFFGSFSEPGSPFLRMAGYYDVSYRRETHGWRIARKVTTTFSQERSAAFGYLPGDGLTTPVS